MDACNSEIVPKKKHKNKKKSKKKRKEVDNERKDSTGSEGSSGTLSQQSHIPASEKEANIPASQKETKKKEKEKKSKRKNKEDSTGSKGFSDSLSQQSHIPVSEKEVNIPASQKETKKCKQKKKWKKKHIPVTGVRVHHNQMAANGNGSSAPHSQNAEPNGWVHSVDSDVQNEKRPLSDVAIPEKNNHADENRKSPKKNKKSKHPPAAEGDLNEMVAQDCNSPLQFEGEKTKLEAAGEDKSRDSDEMVADEDGCKTPQVIKIKPKTDAGNEEEIAEPSEAATDENTCKTPQFEETKPNMSASQDESDNQGEGDKTQWPSFSDWDLGETQLSQQGEYFNQSFTHLMLPTPSVSNKKKNKGKKKKKKHKKDHPVQEASDHVAGKFKGTGHDFCWSGKPINNFQKQGNPHIFQSK